MKGKDIVLITSALPYVNNVPHIGNITGSLLPSDIFARYNRLKGNIVFYLCGTDDHGSTTEVEAIKRKKKPEEIVKFFHNVHKEIYKWFNFSFDQFSQTSNNPLHYKMVQELFIKAYINGYIVEKEVELPYDPEWNKFLADRFVVGKCPYCGYENARGDQCESCGRLLDPKELIDPKNSITGNKIIFRKTKHLYLNLTKLEDKIKEYLESKKGIFTDLAITMSLSWIKEGLKERSITRDLSFGVPVPYKELWQITIKKIFNRLSFNSKDAFIDSLINALREEGLVINTDEYTKILKIVEENWPKIDSILNLYNHFEEYKDKVLYVWYDALIGYISFAAQKLKEEYLYDDVKDENINNVSLLEDNGKIIKIKINNKIYELEYKVDGNVLYLSRFYSEFFNLYKILKFLFENKKVIKIILDINWKDFWINGKVYHFLGKDNIPFHAVFWPAILLSTHNVSDNYKEFFEYTKLDNYSLPYNVIGLSYLTYENRKISKSQNWGIFCDSLIKSDLDPDYWRFYLSYILPYNRDSDFKWNDFQSVINNELINNIGNLTHRVLSFVRKYYNNKVDGGVRKDVISKITDTLNEYHKYMDKGEFNLALRKILELSNYGNKIFQENKPWENHENNKSLVKSLVILLISVYTMLYPFIPNSSERFFEFINYKEISFDNLNILLQSSNNIVIEIVKEPQILFSKVDDDLINKLKQTVTKPSINL